MIDRLSTLDPESEAVYGNKSTTLARLKQAGFRIPDGIALDGRLSTRNSIPGSVREQLDTYLSSVETPWVAVRSSANVEDGAGRSFAGLFESFLIPTDGDIMDTIRQCHNYRDAQRVQTYCKAVNVAPEEIAVGVLVQNVIQSDACGVSFSQHPVSGADQTVIEASFGMIHSDQDNTTPQRLILDNDDIVEHSPPQQTTMKTVTDGILQTVTIDDPDEQPINLETAREIARKTEKIKTELNHPVDVEWAVTDDTVWILQARPITTAHIPAKHG